MIVATKFALLTLVTAALNLPITKVSNRDSSRLAKRGNWATDIRGNGLSYLAEVEIGSPPQKNTVIIDTGSSDLWFITPDTCNTDANGNAPEGEDILSCNSVYDVSKSSSLVNTTKPFAIKYGDGSSSNGFYVQDTLGIAGTTLDSANVAYAYHASAPSIMGIGFMNGEACVRWRLNDDNTVVRRNTSCTPYENVPQQLKSQGKISSTAYSIWLNDLSTQKGNILFGGVDHKKYLGKLVTLPIDAEPVGYQKSDGSTLSHFPLYTRTLVTLNQITLFGDDGSSDIVLQGAVPVLLDTGSTQCSLPSVLIDSLAKAFDAKPDGQGGYFLDCGVSDNAYIAFNFRGLEIKIPLRQFIRPEVDYYGDRLVDQSTGFEYCSLGASSGDADSFFILGDNVLSSFYGVFDLENGEIALAPAIFNQYDTDVEDISGSIPGAIQAPAYSYSFSSHLQINPSPTVTFTATPVTSVYGQTGTVVKYDLTGTQAQDNAQAVATAYFANVANIVKDDDKKDFNGTTTSPAAAAATDDTNGVTDIIGTGITQSLPEGIFSVYSAGAPSTLGLPSSSGVSNTSSSASASSTVTPVSNTTSVSATTTGPSGISNSTTATDSTPNATRGAQGGATVTSHVTVLTTYCPEPTTFSWGNSAYTVTKATTLTITSCDAEATPTASGNATKNSVIHTPARAPGPVVHNVDTVTKRTTVFTTFCPEPTTFSYGGSTYVVTKPTTLTITSCPPEESATPTVTPSSPIGVVSTPEAKSTPAVFSPVSKPDTPTEVNPSDVPTIESNGALQLGICGALAFIALL